MAKGCGRDAAPLFYSGSRNTVVFHLSVEGCPVDVQRSGSPGDVAVQRPAGGSGRPLFRCLAAIWRRFVRSLSAESPTGRASRVTMGSLDRIRMFFRTFCSSRQLPGQSPLMHQAIHGLLVERGRIRVDAPCRPFCSHVGEPATGCRPSGP